MKIRTVSRSSFIKFEPDALAKKVSVSKVSTFTSTDMQPIHSKVILPNQDDLIKTNKEATRVELSMRIIVINNLWLLNNEYFFLLYYTMSTKKCPVFISSISPSNLGQFPKSGTVLKYTGSQLSKTVPDFEIWPTLSFENWDWKY